VARSKEPGETSKKLKKTKIHIAQRKWGERAQEEMISTESLKKKYCECTTKESIAKVIFRN